MTLSFPHAVGGNPITLSEESANGQPGCPTKAFGHDRVVNGLGIRSNDNDRTNVPFVLYFLKFDLALERAEGSFVPSADASLDLSQDAGIAHKRVGGVARQALLQTC